MSEPETVFGWLVIFPRKKDAKMPCQNITNTEIEYLKRFLPENHETHVCKLQVKSETSFSATLRTRMTTELEARQWLNDFERKTLTTWRVNQTFPRKEKARNSFKICLHCHHNTKGRGVKNKYKTKNTSCKAILMICVKRVEQFNASNKKSRSKDVHFIEFPTRIVLRNDHNHTCEDSLPFRDVSKPTKDKLMALLERGHNPYSMHERLVFDLKSQYGANYDAASKDRALCPDIHYCYRLYYDVVKKKREEIYSRTSLERIISEYNELCGSVSAACSFVDSSTVIALCTPVMKRVNSLMRYSGELVFIDSTGNFEQFGCKLYLLLTHSNSVAGGLPIGVIIITQGESQAAISAGLCMLTNIMGENGFFRRGSEGPQVFLTDDFEPLRSAITETFPNSYSILCTFRFLQAVWKWLWNSQNEIEIHHRHLLLQIVKEIMYAPSVNAVIETYQNYALLNPNVNRYPHFREYLRTQVQRQHLWALAFRQHLLVRGYTTNSLSETAFHLISQSCLKRTKMFHFHQMIDFIIVQLEQHFQNHLQDIAEGTCTHGPIPKFLMKKIHLVPREKIKQISDTEFVIQGVEHRSNFTVDTDLEMCSCAFASKHNSCKHLFSVFHHFNIFSLAHLANTEMTHDTKHLLCCIAKGDANESAPTETSVNQEKSEPDFSANKDRGDVACNNEGEVRVWDVELSGLIQGQASSSEEERPANTVALQDGNGASEQETGKRPAPPPKSNINKKIKPVTVKLRCLMDNLNQRLKADPDLMVPSLDHFINAMMHFKSNQKLAEALSRFHSENIPQAQEEEILSTRSSNQVFNRTSEETYRPPDHVSGDFFTKVSEEPFELVEESLKTITDEDPHSKKRRFEEESYHRCAPSLLVPVQAGHVSENSFLLEHTYSLSL